MIRTALFSIEYYFFKMWMSRFGSLPPTWALVDFDSVTALHFFPTDDDQVEML